MKVLKIYNQYRRDCRIDLKCENCGHEEINQTGYDDRNFWDNVIPDRKCPVCGKSTNDLGLKPDSIKTKYDDWEIV